MDLSTSYLGLKLPHPLMPGASPLVDDLDAVRRLEDAGASAIVMHSLFEEQLAMERAGSGRPMDTYEESFAEALALFPNWIGFRLGPDQYLEQLHRIKRAVRVPVIASLNGTSAEGWLHFGRLMQQAGADALELNVYHPAGDPGESGHVLERRVVEMLQTVREHLTVPVAIKLSPYYTALAHFARQLGRAGADGLVLFNRFHQPDIDPGALETAPPQFSLSSPVELPLRLRWLAILSGRLDVSLAVSGGVHGPLDAVKALLAGAHAVQMVSALLRQGPQHLATVHQGLRRWMEEHEYESLEQMRGRLSLARCPDPKAHERASYLEVLQSWGA